MTMRRFVPVFALGAVALVTIVAIVGATLETAARRRALRDFPIRGRLIEVGEGRRLQLDCRGTGSPTVVLESGLDVYGSLAWAAVQDSIAATTRVCAYSRAGILWSDPADGAFSAEALARDLHTALVTAGESAPWVMVGHSLGGPYVMLFASRYGPEVGGMVLVDATHPDQFAHFQAATGKSLLPSPASIRLGAALAWTGLLRLLPSTPVSASWPTEVDRISAVLLPRSIPGALRDIEGIPATLAAAGHHRDLGNTPLVVLTAGRPATAADLDAMGLTADQGARLHAAALVLQDDEATWSRHARHEIVPDASHYIQLDRPDVVIRAVRDVIRAARTSSR